LPVGGLVDRSQMLDFMFDGRCYTGHPGDTLASALLANGVRLFGRSFKYHRPRGVFSAGVEEPNALVELRSGARREPNTRATSTELYAGLTAQSQNRWPSLRCDLQAVSGLFSPLLSAGFYYKTFMWPAAFWEKVYEPLIRRAAGLGRAADAADPDSYEKSYAFCDVLVIGGGAAGLMAALTAGRSGARVILADEDFVFGGRCLAERRSINGQSGAQWVAAVLAELQTLPEVRLLPRTTVFGRYDDGVYGAVERVSDHWLVPPQHQPRQRLWQLVARRTVLASGSIERPLLFGDNDRPGVMLAGAVRTYLNRYAVAPWRRAVVFTDNDEGWNSVFDLQVAGVEVAAVVDPRHPSVTERLVRQLQHRRGLLSLHPAYCPLIFHGVVARAHGAHGVQAVDIVSDHRPQRVACDLLAVSGGWTPTLHLTSHLGHRPRWDDSRALFLPDRLPAGMQVAGAANGEFTLLEALTAGQRAGLEAALALGLHCTAAAAPATEADESSAGTSLWQVSKSRGKCFVDLQNDVTTDDLALARREGFVAVEHQKRYTTLGMATDQGKTSNVNGIGVLAALTGQTLGSAGSTRFRPPYTPVALGALASHSRGLDFRPTRFTPAHDWAVAQGAVFIEAGAWLRAQYFPRPGESDWLTSVTREVNAVRSAVGVCDVSTLGKIDLQGTDAATFLERVYVNAWRSLPVGRARYGLMLREDGYVMDDGTVSRLATERYLITTTTANAVGVYQHLQYCHQVLWPELEVQFTSVTDRWAQFAIAGPRSRRLLERVINPEHELSDTAFPYLAATTVTLRNGVYGRLFRLSFCGELAYELAVPASGAVPLLHSLFAAGADLGITPYGTEALGVMRVEKGHPAGSELNGQTTAYDLGLERLLAKHKDYIGAVMAQRPFLLEPTRLRLVGLRPVNQGERLYAGAHLLPLGAPMTAANDQGYITAVAYSPSLGHWIALGLLASGPERHGERMRACDPLRGREVGVEVCAPIFVDPAGARLRG
jgi:sarcosine oxidase subunit alpha